MGLSDPKFAKSATRFSAPSVTTLTYQGSKFAAEWVAGLPLLDVPFSADPRPYICRVPYKVKVGLFSSLAVDSFGPYGGYHAGESDFRDYSGGVIGFTREFALIPDSRSEYESYTYGYQTVSLGGALIEVPITVPSRIQYDYFRTDVPSAIELSRAPRLFDVEGVIYQINGWEDLEYGDEFLAEDASLRVWKGKIYERRQRFVEFLNIVDTILP